MLGFGVLRLRRPQRHLWRGKVDAACTDLESYRRQARDVAKLEALCAYLHIRQEFLPDYQSEEDLWGNMTHATCPGIVVTFTATVAWLRRMTLTGAIAEEMPRVPRRRQLVDGASAQA